MNPLLSSLQPYPFERLKQLFSTVTPNPAYAPISLGIGEPKHATPEFIKTALIQSLDTALSGYPATIGELRMREACAQWLKRRYSVDINAATQSADAREAVASTRDDPLALALALAAVLLCRAAVPDHADYLHVGDMSAPASDLAWLGDLLAVAAGAFWGLTTVVIRASRLSSLSPEKVLFYQVAISALVLPFVAWGLGERPTLDISSFAWLSLFLQTFVGAFASYLTWMWMLAHYPATKISVFVFLTPIFALLFGTLWLGETLTPGLMAALTGVAIGIVLVNRKSA